jgi:N-formylmethionyl-tRNA deformylase
MPKDKVLTLWNNVGVNEKDAFILRKKSVKVPVPLNKESREAIQTLIDSFLGRDDALGLAAPQIGINKRIVVFRNKGFDERGKIKNSSDFEVLVNPRITPPTYSEKITMVEGCLSCPEIQVEVTRFYEINVCALDAQGKKISKRYLDYAARVVQHELDHLDGKLIVDYGGTRYCPTYRQSFFENIFKFDKLEFFD